MVLDADNGVHPTIPIPLSDRWPLGPTNATIDIYSIETGQRVKQVNQAVGMVRVPGEDPPLDEWTGSYQWNGSTDGGVAAPKGLYAYDIQVSHKEDGWTWEAATGNSQVWPPWIGWEYATGQREVMEGGHVDSDLRTSDSATITPISVTLITDPSPLPASGYTPLLFTYDISINSIDMEAHLDSTGVEIYNSDLEPISENDIGEAIEGRQSVRVDVDLSQPGDFYYTISAMCEGKPALEKGGILKKSVILDTTAPSEPLVSDDGNYTADSTQLHAVWDAEDAESGIAEYQYAVGTSSSDLGSSYTVGWTSVGTDTSVTHTNLALTEGITYYFYVKARNSAGLWSGVGVSNGITVAYIATTVSQALSYPAGAGLELEGRKVATNAGEFENAFYVQDPSAPIKGIRIVCSESTTYSGLESVSRGQILNVTGQKLIDDVHKESYILAESVVYVSTDNAPAATIITQQRWLGGANFDGNYGVNCPYYGGTYNKGVLVRSYGQVTAVFIDEKCFYVDDGSYLVDTTHGGVRGVRVSWDINGADNQIMPPLAGWHVSINGISSSHYIGNDASGNPKIIRVLRPRNQNDITINQGGPPMVYDPVEAWQDEFTPSDSSGASGQAVLKAIVSS